MLIKNSAGVDDVMRLEIITRQVARCKVTIDRAGAMDVVASSELSQSIIASCLPDGFKRELTQAIVASSVSLPIQGGTKFQDYTTLRHFITQSVAQQAGAHGFSSALFRLAAKLGLRKGSGNTFKELTILQLLAIDGLEDVVQECLAKSPTSGDMDLDLACDACPVEDSAPSPLGGYLRQGP